MSYGPFQLGQLARPEAQPGGVDNTALSPSAALLLHAVHAWELRRIGAHGFELDWHQGLGAQHAARRLGRIGVDHPLATLPLSGQGFK